MSDSRIPLPPDSGAPLRSHRVTVDFDVHASSQEYADWLVRVMLIASLGKPRTEAEPPDYGRVPGVLSWAPADRVQAQPEHGSALSPEWAPFEGSGIPEIVARMFPPLPAETDHQLPDGELDVEGFEDAMQQWRDDCLELAVQASHLPELLEHVEQLEAAQTREARVADAERVRDGLIDLLERDPLPAEPRKEDYLVTVAPSYEGEYDDMRFRWDHSQWRTDFVAAANRREQTLNALLAEGGQRTNYLPEQFQHDWIPADLVALHTLRALVDSAQLGTGEEIGREEIALVERLLEASDLEVRVLDPDDPTGVELYEGPGSEAHDWLPPGIYDATGQAGVGEYRVVVGRMPGGETTSAAFPPVEHDSATLNAISRVLERDTRGTELVELLAHINALVVGTGRTGVDPADITPAQVPLTRLEQGVMLSDLLAERAQHLNPQEESPTQGLPKLGPGRDL